MEKPIITICILHYNKLPQLKKTIKLIKKKTKVPYKIDILNQKYTNQEIEKYLNEINQETNINVTFSEKNLGCPGGRNLQLKNTNTPYAATLDDDIYVEDNWLKPVINFLEKNKKAGAVSYPLYQPNGEIDSVGGKYLKINKRRKTIVIKEPEPSILKNKDKFIEIDDTLGGAMAFKTDLLNHFQWDPNYFIGFGDLDKGMQLQLNSKYKYYLYTKPKLIHDKVSKDKKKKEYNKKRRDYHKIRESYLYFNKKWGYHFTQPRDFFYRYICLLPNSIVQQLAYLWLGK